MKGLTVFVFGILLLGFSLALDCSGETDLISYWQFEGDSTDGFGSNDLSLSGSPEFLSGSVFGSSVYFEGLSKYSTISSPDASLQFSSSEDFTISGWVNPTTISQPRFFGMYSGATTLYAISISSSNIVSFVWNGVTVASASIAIPSDDWSYVSVTKTGDSFKLYVDGSLVNSGTSSDDIDYSSAQLFVGLMGNAKVDEVAVWSRALSSSEILTNYVLMKAGYDYCYDSGSDEDSSDTEAQFEVPGCEGGIASGGCSRSILNPFYCSGSDELGVFEGYSNSVAGACNLVTFGVCCPSGYECRDDNGDGSYFCEVSAHECSFWDNEADCMDETEGRNCVWLGEDDGYCEDPDAIGCGDYWDEASCNADSYAAADLNLADVCSGTGVDKYGNVVVPDAACTWNDLTDKCEYVCHISPSISSGDPFNLACHVSESHLSDCGEDGQRVFSWTVYVESSGGSVTQTEIDEFIVERGCESGTKYISCGESLTSLPFFGWTNFVFAALAIGLFYVFWKRD